MAIVLDESTRAEYLALSSASSRASLVVDRLQFSSGTTAQAVYVEIYNGSNVLVASGTMASPWATYSGATITVGEVNSAGVYVTTGGTPDSLWYCQIKGANGRFVRGSFGVSTSTADFKWNLGTFQAGSRGTLGTVTLVTSGTALPVLLTSPSISGAPQVGQTLTLSTGTWQSDTTLTYARQWLRGGSPVSGQTGSTYTLTSSDMGFNIGGTVTATNSSGGVSASATQVGPVTSAGDPTGLPLLYETNVSGSGRYVGAFKLPTSGTNPYAFDQGGYACAYNPNGNGGAGSLLISGRFSGYLVAEVTIPTPVNSASVSALPTASHLQIAPYFASTMNDQQHLAVDNTGGDGEAQLWGLLVYDGDVITTVGHPYDNGPTYPDPGIDGGSRTRGTHFRHEGTTLGSTNVTTYKYFSPLVGGVMRGRRWFNGAMCHVPAEWQTLLGGSVIQSNRQQSIWATQSNGPFAAAFNPDNLYGSSPVPCNIVLGYPIEHPLAPYVPGAVSPEWTNAASIISGVCIPPNSRSILFFGCTGTGPNTYGAPGTVDDSSGILIVDPVNPDKGYHAYPYEWYCWAYDLNDLVAVKNGTKQPWEPRPYAKWTMTFTGDDLTRTRHLNSTCYDIATKRLFVMEISNWRNPDAMTHPIVHVFQMSY